MCFLQRECQIRTGNGGFLCVPEYCLPSLGAASFACRSMPLEMPLGWVFALPWSDSLGRSEELSWSGIGFQKQIVHPVIDEQTANMMPSRNGRGRKRVIGILAAILASLHLERADDLFGGPQGSPRTEKLPDAILHAIVEEWLVPSLVEQFLLVRGITQQSLLARYRTLE